MRTTTRNTKERFILRQMQWTSPNHRAYVAITVHLQHKGVPLCMILDVVEVAKVTFFNARFTARSMYQLNDLQSHTGLNLAVCICEDLKGLWHSR